MNDRSSRSHSVFTMVLAQTKVGKMATLPQRVFGVFYVASSFKMVLIDAAFSVILKCLTTVTNCIWVFKGDLHRFALKII